MNACNVSNKVLVSPRVYKAPKHLEVTFLRARPGGGYGSGAVITLMKVASKADCADFMYS